MANLTYAQLEGLWIQNGGSPASAPMAAAIAMAESGGNPLGPPSANSDGGTNVGLWQLDTKGKGAGLSVAQLEDPNVNASAAVGGSRNGADWSAWETYANGAYKAFLNTSSTPTAAGLPQSSGSLTGAAAVVAQSNVCVIPYPSLNLGFVSAGGGCILSKSQARGVIGTLLLTAGMGLAVAGAVIVAVAAFEHSGAAKAVGETTPVVRTVVRVASRGSSGASAPRPSRPPRQPAP